MHYIGIVINNNGSVIKNIGSVSVNSGNVVVCIGVVDGLGGYLVTSPLLAQMLKVQKLWAMLMPLLRLFDQQPKGKP